METICAYGYYRVNVSYKWCSRDEYDYDIGQYIFNNYKNKSSQRMNGGELMEFIAKYLTSKDICEVSFGDNKIYISEFDPFSGETNDVKITFKPLKKTVFDK